MSQDAPASDNATPGKDGDEGRGPAAAPDPDERTWAMIAHLSAFAVMIVPALGPLVVWRARGSASAFVASQAKEALNFNLTVTLAGLVCLALFWFGIGVPLAVLLFLGWFSLTILAAIRANEGIDYRYPVTLRLVR
jgi:uncharacterized protein